MIESKTTTKILPKSNVAIRKIKRIGFGTIGDIVYTFLDPSSSISPYTSTNQIKDGDLYFCYITYNYIIKNKDEYIEFDFIYFEAEEIFNLHQKFGNYKNVVDFLIL